MATKQNTMDTSPDEENSIKSKEEKKPKQKTSIKGHFLQYWSIGFKLIELVICVICMGTIYEPASNLALSRDLLHHIGIMYTAYTGYILINSTFLLANLVLRDSIPYKTVAMFAISGAALFLVTSILLITDRSTHFRSVSYHPHSYRLSHIVTAIIFGFINAIVFSVDAVLTLRLQNDF